MKKISEYNLNEVLNKFVTIVTPTSLKPFVGDQTKVMAFCFIGTAGDLCFQIMDDRIAQDILLKYDESFEVEVVDISTVSQDKIHKSERILDFSTAAVSPFLIELRKLEELDGFRDKHFPDDILVPTYTNIPDNKMQLVWMRPSDIEQDVIVATAIESRESVAKGDMLCLVPSEEDGLMAVPYETYESFLKEEMNEVQN